MKSLKYVFVLLTIVMALGANTMLAQNGLPSSKATADINTLVVCDMSSKTNDDATFTIPDICKNVFTGTAVDVDPDGYVTIMEKPMKLSNSQSLIVSPSLVTGLYTQTRTKTNTGTTSTAQAMGAVYLRAVIVDSTGREYAADPLSYCNSGILGCVEVTKNNWGVILDSRIQTLTQEISNCVVNVGILVGTCTFTSTIDLTLQTTSAHSYNFIFPNVGVGVYTLKIKAAVGSGASIIGSGSAIGAAAFGLGSMTAESVRLVHDFSF